MPYIAANVGGLTDLFIGLSFFTFYQFIEWLVTKTVGKLTVKKRIIDSINDIQVEDTGLWSSGTYPIITDWIYPLVDQQFCMYIDFFTN